MADPFRVGEVAELCNLPADVARFNGREVIIVEPLADRKWRIFGTLHSGPAYIVCYEGQPRVACEPRYLRKRRPPIDTVDSAEPNKVTDWTNGPWKPRTTHV